MNADHADALRDYCRHVHHVNAVNATMVGIDCDGFDVRADDQLLRFDFDATLSNPGQVRNRLVALAHAARGEL
jgi:putative heme iron utilization protein